jgi:5-methylcytosine-specific restriction enzyme subunit McrC
MLEADGTSIVPGREVFEYDKTGDLVPAFATFFVRHFERAVGRGLRRQYVDVTEPVLGVRGRINVREGLRLGGLAVPIICDYDHHTLDTQLNRMLLGATARLARLSGVAQDTRRTLLQIVGLFDDEVGGVRPSDLDRATRFSRLDEHLRGVEHLARLVLTGESITDAKGSATAATFLVDMNTVFERFVEARLRRTLLGRLQVLGQNTTSLDVDGSVTMRPDLLFADGRRPAYVGDAKYKLTADGFGRESDYYQLLAYCTALDLPEGVLVYCQHDGSAPPQRVVVRGPGGRTLRTVAVRLDGSPGFVDEQLAQVAEDVWSRVDAQRSGANVLKEAV